MAVGGGCEGPAGCVWDGWGWGMTPSHLIPICRLPTYYPYHMRQCKYVVDGIGRKPSRSIHDTLTHLSMQQEESDMLANEMLPQLNADKSGTLEVRFLVYTYVCTPRPVRAYAYAFDRLTARDCGPLPTHH